MNILQSIIKIDNDYEPDPAGGIEVIGTCADGLERHFYIYNTGDGPLIEPGPWFPAPEGVWFNPLIVHIRA